MRETARDARGEERRLGDIADFVFAIEEREVSKIFKGQLCKIRPEGFPERVYEGQVSRLMPTADRAKSAIPVRVKLKVPKERSAQITERFASCGL